MFIQAINIKIEQKIHVHVSYVLVIAYLFSILFGSVLWFFSITFFPIFWNTKFKKYVGGGDKINNPPSAGSANAL